MNFYDQFLDSDKSWDDISGSPSAVKADTTPSVRQGGDPFDDFLDTDKSWNDFTKDNPEFSFSRLGKQALRSAGQGVADIGRFAGALESQVSELPGGQQISAPEEEMGLESEKTTEPREVRRERLQEYFDQLPQPLEGSSGIIEEAITGMARFLPSMAVSAVNPIAGTAMTFAQIAGMSYDDYIKQGADKDTAFSTAVINSMAQTPLEMAGNLLQIGALKNLAKSVGAGAKMGSRLQAFVGALMAGVVGEGMEEFLQQFPDEIANYYIANPDLSAKEIAQEVWNNKGEIAKRGAQAAKVGAVGGGLLAGAGGVIATPFHLANYVSEKQSKINEKTTPPIESIKQKFESGEFTRDDLEFHKELWPELSKDIDTILKPTEVVDKTSEVVEEPTVREPELVKPDLKTVAEELEKRDRAKMGKPAPEPVKTEVALEALPEMETGAEIPVPEPSETEKVAGIASEESVEPVSTDVKKVVEIETKGKKKEVLVDISKKKAETLTPKEQKTYLMAEIDRAIEDQAKVYGTDIETFEKLSKDLGRDFEKTKYYTIEVPGDGEFSVTGSQLFHFKKRVSSIFPTAEPKPYKTKFSKSKPVPRKRRVSETNVFKGILNRRKPEDLTPKDVDPLLLSAKEYDIDEYYKTKGVDVYTEFINYLLEHDLKPETLKKVRRSFLEKDFTVEIKKKKLNEEKDQLEYYKEQLPKLEKSFNEIDVHIQKINKKEVTIKATLEKLGYKTKKKMMDEWSQRKSNFLRMTSRIGETKQKINELSETVGEGIVYRREKPSTTLSMLGTQGVYEGIKGLTGKGKKNLTPKQVEFLQKHYPEKLKRSDNTGAEESRNTIDAAKEVLHKHFTGFMYWVVDKNRPIQSVQNKLDEVTEDIDLFMRETQRPKIAAAKVKDFWDKSVKPLLGEIAKSQKNIPDVEIYAHAKHAREANAALRLANSKRYYESVKGSLTPEDWKGRAQKLEPQTPEQYNARLNELLEEFKDNKKVQKIKSQWETFSERPSGMSDTEADAVLEEYKDDPKVEKIRQLISEINDEKLEILYNAGLLSDEEYENIKGKYKFYVPLYREGYEDSVSGTGKGLQPAGRPIKTRGGSVRNVVNILANTISNYENAIDRAEKAQSAKTLLRLVQENPNPEIWSIKPQKQTPRYDKNGNLRMYPDISSVSENEIRIMVDGKQYLIEVNRFNKDAMLMLRTLKSQDKSAGPIVNSLAKVNRWLARINTSWSPEFIISNFARDIQTAGVNIGDTGVDSKRVFRGAVDGIRAIYAVERGKSTGTEYEKLYERFKSSGGKIGWSDVHGSVESLADKITKELEMQAGKRPARKLVTDWVQWIEDANTSIENGVRLHVFKLALDSGKSDIKAAQIASDITVDFTKKGAAGPVINSLYLFANAGIQGSYRIFRAMSKSSKVRKMGAGIVGIGFTIGLLNTLAGEDEDGEDYYNKIDDFVRERNMIIMLPGTKGKYAKIPLPWGYNFLFNVGTEMSRVFTKENYEPMNGAARIASTFVNAFNPIASGTLFQTILPTVADPFAMVYENKNWFGGDLMPPKDKFEKVPTPDSQRYWKSARSESKWVARQLNELTGGSKVRAGEIDVSPETLDLMVDTVGGSAMRFFRDTFSIPEKLAKQEEIKMYEVPFLRRVAGEQSEWSDSRIYFDNITQVLTAKEELNVYKGTPYYDILDKKLNHLRPMFGMAKSSESTLRKLRKAKKIHEAKGNKERVEFYENKIKDIYIKFNKKFYKAKKPKEQMAKPPFVK